MSVEEFDRGCEVHFNYVSQCSRCATKRAKFFSSTQQEQKSGFFTKKPEVISESLPINSTSPDAYKWTMANNQNPPREMNIRDMGVAGIYMYEKMILDFFKNFRELTGTDAETFEAVLEFTKENSMDVYQLQARKTLKGHDPNDWTILCGLGLAGESGEVADVIKKWKYHKHKLDEAKLVEELGDALWYLAGVATSIGVDLSDVAKSNMDKTRKRYPEGFFTSERSINREEITPPTAIPGVQFKEIDLNLYLGDKEKTSFKCSVCGVLGINVLTNGVGFCTSCYRELEQQKAPKSEKVEAWKVIGCDSFNYEHYDLGTYPTKAEADALADLRNREAPKKQPGGMHDRYHVEKVLIDNKHELYDEARKHYDEALERQKAGGLRKGPINTQDPQRCKCGEFFHAKATVTMGTGDRLCLDCFLKDAKGTE